SRRPTSRSANDHSPPRDRAHRSSGTRSKWRRRMFAQTLSGHVWAVPNWPNRFVRLIVPFPPGGGADAIARIVSARLSETWGQQVVIENRGGASGNIAAEAAARSAPDGYTIFLAGDFQAVNLYLYPKLSYDPVADFAPVTLVVQYPSAMVVPNSSPSHSVTEFIAYAKANRGTLRFASPGHGTSPHLAGELFKRAAGIEMTTVPYRGARNPRRHPRARRRLLQQYRPVAVADAAGPVARARGDDRQTHTGGARVADAGGDRADGFRRLRMVCLL